MKNSNSAHYKLMRVMNRFRGEFRMDKVLGIKKSEVFMMLSIDSYMQNHKSVTVSRISQMMHMTNAAASKTIGSLEDQGYILKVINKEDKRQSYLELTENGKKKLAEIHAEMNSFAEAVITQFGDDNMEKLYQLLDQINEIAEQEIKTRLGNSQLDSSDESEKSES